MFQVRVHGRGGQGAVTTAELLSLAAFLEGKFAQAFPSFGSERMGAPVASFCRIDEVTIRLREPVVEPDALIIQDATLLHAVDVFQGLKPEGYVLLNTTRSIDALGLSERMALLPARHAQTIAANELATRHVGRPLPGGALLGALAALTGAVGLPSVTDAMRARFPGALGEANARSAREAYELVLGSRPC